MSDKTIETQLKIIADLKRETDYSHSILTIKRDGSFTYYFTLIRVTLKANAITVLLERVIEYIIVNRKYKGNINTKEYPSQRKRIITKYKLIKKDGTGKRFKTT